MSVNSAEVLRPFRFTFQCTRLTNKDIRYFGKERRNELFSPAKRTSGGFDCRRFDPDSAKALELRDRLLPHNNRDTRVDSWPLVPLIPRTPLNPQVYQPPALSLPPGSLCGIIPHPTNYPRHRDHLTAPLSHKLPTFKLWRVR